MIFTNKLHSCILIFCVQNVLGQLLLEPSLDDRFFFFRYEEPAAADQESVADADAPKTNADSPEVRIENHDPNPVETQTNIANDSENSPAAAGLGFSFPFRIQLSPFNIFGDSKNDSVSNGDDPAQRSLPNDAAAQNDSSVNQRALPEDASLSEQKGPSISNVQSDKSGPLVERSLADGSESVTSQNDTAERFLPGASGNPQINDSSVSVDQRSLPLETNSSVSNDAPPQDGVVQRSLQQPTQNITDTAAQPEQRQLPNVNTGNDEFDHPIEEIENRSANLTDSSIAVRSQETSSSANATSNSQIDPQSVPSN